LLLFSRITGSALSYISLMKSSGNYRVFPEAHCVKPVEQLLLCRVEYSLATADDLFLDHSTTGQAEK
jgi:hypothetical protein